MAQRGTIALIASLICFIIYFTNVAIGAAGTAPFFGDVMEMLTLFVSAVLFVVGVLDREAAEAPAETPDQD